MQVSFAVCNVFARNYLISIYHTMQTIDKVYSTAAAASTLPRNSLQFNKRAPFSKLRTFVHGTYALHSNKSMKYLEMDVYMRKYYNFFAFIRNICANNLCLQFVVLFCFVFLQTVDFILYIFSHHLYC